MSSDARSRRAYPFLWVDAFTDKPFQGNPCAVVFDADAIPVEQRLAYTRETRLSECAFLQASDKADFGVRYYLASREILFAGHPTIATVTAMKARGMIKAPCAFTLEVGAGVIPIEVALDGAVTFTSPRPVFGRTWKPAEIAALVGLSADDVAAAPETVSTGTAFCITLVKSAEALGRAKLDVEALLAFHERDDCDFWEPFLVTLGGATEAGDIHSRLLLAPPEPPEDPFTGSATTCAAAWLWARGHITEPRIVAEQGFLMGRPSRGTARCLGPMTAPQGVRLTGRGVVAMQGEALI